VPGTGEPGAGEPGAGDPGAGEPDAGEPDAGEPGAAASPPPGETEPLEAKIGMKPVNGDGETDGLATRGRKGSTSEGTFRTCAPGRAASRIAELSSVEKACIQSWADATAPAATAPT
jgi:hypothetical protein